MRSLWADIRFGLRMMAKSPGFTLIVVLCLALGIGANTAIFSVVNAVLLRPLPFKDPDRLVVLHTRKPDQDRRLWASGADFLDWRERSQAFEEMAACDGRWWNVKVAQAGERVVFTRMTPNFLDMLGIRPMIGRGFLRDEDLPGRSDVVILGHDLWRRKYGGDPDVIGKELKASGFRFAVIGVMPPDLPKDWPLRNCYVPLPREIVQKRKHEGAHVLVLGRLREGRTVDDAQAEMNVIAAQLEREHPEFNSGLRVSVTSMRESMTSGSAPSLLSLQAAVGFVLLIACANVANLLFARNISRQKAIAIRLAVGAGQLRILRQLLIESLLVSLVGCALGALLGVWAVDLLLALAPEHMPLVSETTTDMTVLGFALGISVATAVVLGLLQWIRSSKATLGESLADSSRESSGGPQRHRFLSVAIVIELASTLALLTGAGLMMGSFWRLLHVDPGFQAEGLLSAELSLGTEKYGTWQQRKAFCDELFDRLRSLPEVSAAGGIDFVPMKGTPLVDAEVPSSDSPGSGLLKVANFRITAGYFEAVGIPVLAGRSFTPYDVSHSSPAVAILSQSLSDKLWPNEDSIGQVVRVSGVTRRVVGVVRNAKVNGLAAAEEPVVYTPWVYEWTIGILVRTHGDPMMLADVVRREVKAMDDDLPLVNILKMTEVASDTIALQRFSMILMGVFAATALVLAALGIYGLNAYTVGQRTHEFGIRMALGAQRGDVLRMVIKQGLILTGIGLAIGLGGAFALTRYLRSLLYEVSPTDPLTFAAVTVLLGAVALLACYIPARRATKIDPISAIRYE